MEIEPKEKAEQLIRYFFDEISDFMDWEKSKICAMKVANECLDISYGIHNENYWHSVKDAINVL